MEFVLCRPGGSPAELRGAAAAEMQPAAPSSVAAGQSSSVSNVSMVPSVDDCALRLGVIMLLVWSCRARIPVLPRRRPAPREATPSVSI